jgi:hypothetical protein
MSGCEFKVCKRRKASSTTAEVLNFAADPESRTEASAWEDFLQNSAYAPRSKSTQRRKKLLQDDQTLVFPRLCRNETLQKTVQQAM